MCLGYGDIMNTILNQDCDRFMNVKCMTPECPFAGKDILYCNDCVYVFGECPDCIFWRTRECKMFEEPQK